jgi:L-rhamnose mutarotase
MKRFAFKMHLKSGCEAEYERRHRALWPELEQHLSEVGVFDYSIFLDRETGILFAVQKNRGFGNSQEHGSETPEIVQKWWNYMADLMEINPDRSPVSTPLSELFHLE